MGERLERLTARYADSYYNLYIELPDSCQAISPEIWDKPDPDVLNLLMHGTPLPVRGEDVQYPALTPEERLVVMDRLGEELGSRVLGAFDPGYKSTSINS